MSQQEQVLPYFESQGTLNALGELTIENLLFDTEYRIRSVFIGNEPSDFLTQHTVTNTNTDVLEVTVTIQF